MIPLTSPIKTWNLAGSVVFVRADLNVPLSLNDAGKILDDFRLEKVRATLDAIISQGGRIVLATHLGRPKGVVVSALSTKLIVSWLVQQGYDAVHANHLVVDPRAVITVLENLRFFPEEENPTPEFAQKLASLATFFVNEAFSCSHETPTSLSLLPALFPAERKGIGIRFAEEFSALRKLFSPERPFVVLLGGGKVVEKISFLRQFVEHVDHLLLCPAISQPFLQEQGFEPGDFLVTDDVVRTVREILSSTRGKNVALHLPHDVLISKKRPWGEPFSLVDVDDVQKKDFVISCGPKTVAAWQPIIRSAKTVFFNGPMGELNTPPTVLSLMQLLRTLAEVHAYRVAGGGNAVAAIRHFNLESAFDFCSTGGSATLLYLTTKTLPALRFL